MEHGNTDAFDVAVLGSGSAGMAAARAAASRGASVALFERDQYLGGECPNYACVPTKTLLRAAKTYTTVQHADEVGIHLGDCTLAYAELKRHKDHVVEHTGGRQLTAASLAADGITLFRGTAQFVDHHTLRVDQQRVAARQVVIATGSRTRVPNLDGLTSTPYLTSRTAINLTELPSSIIILGAGPVGVEFAQIFAAFGSDVTLIEESERILLREEPETVEAVAQSLRGYGVQILTNFQAEHVTGDVHGVELRGKDQTDVHTIRASKLMLATGQTPVIDGLGLEAIGVTVTKRGIAVDETLRTSVPHIWAAGDVVGEALYTHAAHAMGSVVGHNLVSSVKRSLNFRVLPRVIFTHLELASVGQTKDALDQAGVATVTGLAPIGTLSRALTDGESDGLVKIVADAQSGAILGASIACVRAGEMIHELALAMELGGTVHDLVSTIHAFPTYSEAIPVAAFDALRKLPTDDTTPSHLSTAQSSRA